MPSPEHYYQRCAEAPVPSPRMQAVITDLAEYHEVDLSQEGARFNVAQPAQDKQWVISNYQGHHIDVAHCPVDDDAFMVPDIDLLLVRTPQGWATEKIIYTDATWQAYAEATATQGQPPVNFPFFAFTEYFAQLLEAEAQLEQASDGVDVTVWLRE